MRNEVERDKGDDLRARRSRCTLDVAVLIGDVGNELMTDVGVRCSLLRPCLADPASGLWSSLDDELPSCPASCPASCLASCAVLDSSFCCVLLAVCDWLRRCWLAMDRASCSSRSRFLACRDATVLRLAASADSAACARCRSCSTSRCAMLATCCAWRRRVRTSVTAGSSRSRPSF